MIFYSIETWALALMSAQATVMVWLLAYTVDRYKKEKS